MKWGFWRHLKDNSVWILYFFDFCVILSSFLSSLIHCNSFIRNSAKSRLILSDWLYNDISVRRKYLSASPNIRQIFDNSCMKSQINSRQKQSAKCIRATMVTGCSIYIIWGELIMPNHLSVKQTIYSRTDLPTELKVLSANWNMVVK